ncbi:MAG TPA: error-prone DNA polymerase, partial [Planctomycetota bacterium]|nr:error-prone DNA polymerase [Planctomycetota bacterium]
AYLALERHLGSRDRERLAEVAAAGERLGIPLVAANDVHYHAADRARLQDVLTCIRRGVTLDEAGGLLFPNAERRVKAAVEMEALLEGHAGAVARTREVAERARFSLDELRYEYPHEIAPEGLTPIAYLAQLTRDGAARRYPGGVPDKVQRQIDHELRLIEELRYEPFFLTVYDIVTFARGKGILCQGRGSAANSAVCYCIGITSVDPARSDALFERFVSRERNEPPDIDVDFEHERREEVIQYVYGKYGRDRAGIVAEVIRYRGRSAVRDVGKALGLSLDQVDRLAGQFHWWSDLEGIEGAARAAGLDPGDRRVRLTIEHVLAVQSFPRHLSQHVGGFVITRGPLCELVPIENAAMEDRTVIEWDKDDIDALGILKVDCLALGMLTAIRKAFGLVESAHGRRLELATVPAEDAATYEMCSRADTVGVFQIESRAQMSMLPRLKPRRFYDLVIQVAIVRPGPIQGGMVHPYLRRRAGEEPVSYPSEALREVLHKTLGVPLFQEQAMRLSMVAAGFTPGEADQLRRAMGAWRRPGVIESMRQRLVDGMRRNGYSGEFAERLFEQLKGFGEYGFPESHAASFALLAYVSAWLKRRHPAAYAAAVLNSQPMGFYAPAQLVRDAIAHGVEVR